MAAISCAALVDSVCWSALRLAAIDDVLSADPLPLATAGPDTDAEEPHADSMRLPLLLLLDCRYVAKPDGVFDVSIGSRLLTGASISSSCLVGCLSAPAPRDELPPTVPPEAHCDGTEMAACGRSSRGDPSSAPSGLRAEDMDASQKTKDTRTAEEKNEKIRSFCIYSFFI